MEGGVDDKERGIERLIFFTDAVVAIAITLLILPLVEIVTAEAAKRTSLPVPELIYDNLSQLFAFALSFVIIARLWIANHGVLVDTARATVPLMWLDIAWVFTIVVLPLPTEISAAYKPTQLIVALYIGCGLLSMLVLTAMTLYLYRRPELQKRGHPLPGAELWGIASSCGGFVIAFVLSLVFPAITYYSLLVLVLTWPLDLILKPRIRRWEAARQKR